MNRVDVYCNSVKIQCKESKENIKTQDKDQNNSLCFFIHLPMLCNLEKGHESLISPGKWSRLCDSCTIILF